MSARRVIHEGRAYVTASSCRFVIFNHKTDGTPYIVRRTSNVDTARKHQATSGGLIVDYVGGKVFGRATGFRWVDAS